MCIICIEIDKNRLSHQEATRNLKEMAPVLEKDHVKEVEKKIFDLFVEEMDKYLTELLEKEDSPSL